MLSIQKSEIGDVIPGTQAFPGRNLQSPICSVRCSPVRQRPYIMFDPGIGSPCAQSPNLQDPSEGELRPVKVEDP